MTDIKTEALEQSTFVVKINPKDEDDAAVTPQTGAWYLKDQTGNDVTSSTSTGLSLSSTMYATFSGTDLSLDDENDNGIRVCSFVGTYNGNRGNGLAIKDECTFRVVNQLNVT